MFTFIFKILVASIHKYNRFLYINLVPYDLAKSTY